MRTWAHPKNKGEATNKSTQEQKQVARLLADDRFCRALKALSGCQAKAPSSVRPGVDDGAVVNDLIDVLPSLVVFVLVPAARPTVPHVFRQKDWASFWASYWTSHTGRTWKALKAFPGQLRRMADEVEKINSGLICPPEPSSEPRSQLDFLVGHSISMLPVILRYYAAAVNVETEKFSAVMKEFPPRQRESPHPGAFLLSLIVKISSGRFHDREVAELLNAADLVLNPGKQDRDKGFDAQTLADLRSRRKRKPPKRSLFTAPKTLLTGA
jgi:hypothetical protein